MLNVILRLLNEVFSLVFPQQCLGCGRELFATQKIICFSCELDLPLTYFHLQHGAKLRDKMGLNPALKEVFSLYFFNKNGCIESLLYQLKYKGNKRVGQFLVRKWQELLPKKKSLSMGLLAFHCTPSENENAASTKWILLEHR